MPITLGTDCSGIGGAEAALRKLGVQYNYLFASESSPPCRRLLEASANPPRIIYPDVTQRVKAPAVDLYVAGFCCQPYSSLGKGRGFEDERDTFVAVVTYLEVSQPTTFLLENVKGVLSRAGVWEAMRRRLTSIKDARTGEQVYNIDWKVVSPHHLGYPQSRQRLFIVGRNRAKLGLDKATTPFAWPDARPASTQGDLDKVLLSDEEALDAEPACARPLTPLAAGKLATIRAGLEARGDEWGHSRPVIVDPHVSSSARIRLGTIGTSRCITHNAYGFYILGRGRYLTSIEALRLQGFDRRDFDVKVLMEGTSRRERYGMAGNAIHVDTVADVLEPLVAALTGARDSL
jgi:DNA (cytosine-5)-methyltransferase 1